MTRTFKTFVTLGVLTATAGGGVWIGRALAPGAEVTIVGDDGPERPIVAISASVSDRLAEGEITEESSALPAQAYAALAGLQDDDRHSLASETDAEILASVEQLIADGACRSAADQLRRIDADHPTVSVGRLWFLRGYCHECLGELDPARQAYEQAVARADSPWHARQARIAHARVMHLSGRDEMVSPALYREVLNFGRGDWDALDADIVHLLAASLSDQTSESSDPENPFDDAALFTSRARFDPRRSLVPLPPSPADGSEADGTDSIRVLQRFGDEPRQIYIEWRAANITIADGLRRLADGLDRPILWDSAIEQHLTGRSVDVDASYLDSSLALDALLSPLGLTWIFTGNAVRISQQSELSEERAGSDRRERAERALQFALTRAPDHPWAAVSCNSLARHKASTGLLDEALQLFAQSRELARGRYTAEADVNEGKLALLSADRPRAMQAFYRCVDTADAHPLKLVAYGYLGRLQLEEGSAREAVASLQRAVALAERTPHDPMLTLELASALLLDGNPDGANSVLTRRRDLFADSDLQGPAAFVAAYSRYQAATDESLREREAANLIQTLTQVDPSRLFGGHWWSLTSQAFNAVGLTLDAERIAQSCVAQTPPFPLRDQMLRALLPSRLARETTEQLHASASQMLADPAQGLGYESQLAVAQIEFRRGLDSAAHERSRLLAEDLSAPREIRASALRLLGHIHQQRSEHAEAIRCFSGLVPGTALPKVDLRVLESPSIPGGGQ